MMVVDLFICLAVAFAAMVLAIMRTVRLHQIERHTVKDSLDTMQRIMDAVTELPNLPAKERLARRRAIVMDILKDVAFVLYWAGDCRDDDSSEVRELTSDLARQIADLQWELLKSRFLFRFRPKLVTDCSRIFDAIERHYRVWFAFIRLLQARYPDLYGQLSLPESP